MNESRRKALFPQVSDEDWNDWHWQVANRIETLEDLKKYISLTPEEEEGVKACLGTLRMAITPYSLSLGDPDDPYDPVRRQAVPTAAELHQSKADLLDRGLIGPGSTQKRQQLLKNLELPEHLTPNALLETLNLLMSREEFYEQ